jgi:hypothetical protein
MWPAVERSTTVLSFNPCKNWYIYKSYTRKFTDFYRRTILQISKKIEKPPMPSLYVRQER